MQLITHQLHINKLPDSKIKTHIQSRYDSLTFETDVPPNIILVEGLLSDVYEQAEPGDPAFTRPHEWVSYWPQLITALIWLMIIASIYWCLVTLRNHNLNNPNARHSAGFFMSRSKLCR